MKPRIFISSTFYDLKYIREDLANFVRSYGYEPILFEDGDIGYTPGKTLDSSCYESMKNSDMVILIIGGEYGSAASGEKKDEFKEYMSVTRKEFRTAVGTGIPVFTMIDKKVMAEYGVYEANFDDIEKENRVMVFPSTKNINVFRFIKEIKGIVTLTIQEFEKSSDIKKFISKQWADMFKKYLGSLRNEKENKKIESSVNEMKTLIQKMDIMLNRVGESVLLTDNPEAYNMVINQQKVLQFCNDFLEAYHFSADIKSFAEREKLISEILDCAQLVHSSGILKNEKDMDELSIKIFQIFDKGNFKVERIYWDALIKLENDFEIVSNKKNIETIIKYMVEDGKFFRLISESPILNIFNKNQMAENVFTEI